MLLFVDTETTGLPRAGIQPRIVSVAWIVAKDRNSQAAYRYSIVKPEGFEIPPEAARVYDITTERAVREGIPLTHALQGLANDITTYRPTAVVAHNIRFDRPIIEAEYQRVGLASAIHRLPGVCTVQLARRRWPGQSAKLDDVHLRLFGSGPQASHRADLDVWSCMQIFFALHRQPTPATKTPSIASMHHDDGPDDGAQEMIDRILAWASRHPQFDSDFVESLDAQLQDRGWLSEKQIEGLKRIINNWHIP